MVKVPAIGVSNVINSIVASSSASVVFVLSASSTAVAVASPNTVRTICVVVITAVMGVVRAADVIVTGTLSSVALLGCLTKMVSEVIASCIVPVYVPDNVFAVLWLPVLRVMSLAIALVFSKGKTQPVPGLMLTESMPGLRVSLHTAGPMMARGVPGSMPIASLETMVWLSRPHNVRPTSCFESP